MPFLAKKTAEDPLFRLAGYLAIFLISAAILSFVQHQPSFRDPDTFYHMKLTMLMQEQGIVRDFPWLPFTTLSEAFTDHHLLYHLALMPFFSAFGPLMGMRMATVVFGAAAITAFYGLLRSHGVRLAFWFALLLATSGGFLFRISLGKATAPSLMLLMLALIAVRKDKPILLFILAWLYVLLHGGWPILVVIMGVSLGAKAIIDRISERHPLHSWASWWFWRRLFSGSRSAWRDFWLTKETKQAAAVLGGIAAGLVINPYFPTNFLFYWEQIVQIAIVNYKDTIGVGSEWYPYAPLNLFGATSVVWLLFAFGLILFTAALLWNDVYRGHGRITRSRAAALASSFLLATLFLFMTLRSKRHVEYFVPFALFFDALFIDLLLQHVDPRKVLAKVHVFFVPRIVIQALLVGYFAFIMPYMATRDVLNNRSSFDRGISWTKYEKASDWLMRHAEPGSVIVHSDWDDFPVLFYQNHRNAYMCGLDPTFFYRHDPVRYWQWVDLTTGKVTSGAGGLMRDSFGAKYAVIEKDHTAMQNALARDPSVFAVYEDDEVWIYAVL